MEQKLQQYQDILRQRGCRASRMREALLRLLLRHSQPLSVPKMLELLAEEGLQPNKTTLYRELTLLEEAGIVTSVHISHGIVSYELADLDHHHHAICTSCSTVIDIHVPEAVHHALHTMEHELKKHYAFQVEDHVVDLRGLCGSCANVND